MIYKKFGVDGPDVSEIGMGTYYDPLWIATARLGWLREKDKKIKAIRAGLEGGINLIDTAEIYGSEPLVAEAIDGFDRSKLFIATKVWSNHLHRKSLIKSLENSLERLKTDYIDLYQVHFPNHKVKIAETMSAMEEMVDKGKIRFIGISNFSLKEMVEAKVALTKHPLSALQLSYSLVNRSIEMEILPYCEKEGIMLLAYYPLGHGKLASQKEKLHNIVNKYNRTAVQIALNWLASRPNVFPIPRASSVEHVRENLGASGWRLSEEDRKALESTFN